MEKRVKRKHKVDSHKKKKKKETQSVDCVGIIKLMLAFVFNVYVRIWICIPFSNEREREREVRTWQTEKLETDQILLMIIDNNFSAFPFQCPLSFYLFCLFLIQTNVQIFTLENIWNEYGTRSFLSYLFIYLLLFKI